MKEINKLPYARRQKILEILKEGDCFKVEDLAESMNVSNMTIYRDILQLEKTGDVTRFHGGVMSARKGGSESDDGSGSPLVLQPYTDKTIEERFNEQLEAKRAIAKAAAAFVQDGDVVAIDASTTTIHMCPYLAEKEIIVVTTSPMVALQFASSQSVTVLICGGTLRRSSLSIVGNYMDAIFDRVRINKCFISSHGFSFEHGLTDKTIEESESKHRMVENAAETFVLIDHSKVNKYSAFVACHTNEIDHIITDRETLGNKSAQEIMQHCESAGCDVIYAEQ